MAKVKAIELVKERGGWVFSGARALQSDGTYILEAEPLTRAESWTALQSDAAVYYQRSADPNGYGQSGLTKAAIIADAQKRDRDLRLVFVPQGNWGISTPQTQDVNVWAMVPTVDQGTDNA